MNNNLHPSSEPTLTEPHFDEEATVLSAQPVVPLRKIEAKERSGKRIALGLTVMLSLLVGALGGAVIYKQRGQKQSTAVLDAAIPGVEGVAIAEPLPAAEVAEPVTKAEPAPETKQLPVIAAPAAATKSVESRPRRVEAAKRAKQAPVETGDWEQQRAERIEAWRARRKQEREEMKEARRYRNRADDLLRIREIFEGSRRP